MMITHVAHPTLGHVCVVEEDINAFGVKLKRTSPHDMVIFGKKCRFYPTHARFMAPLDPDDETKIVLFNGREIVFEVSDGVAMMASA